MTTDVVLTRSERRLYYVDSEDVIRRRDSKRKRRSDYGTKRAHPPGCLHCESVETYRTIREAAIEANGGFRNENAHEGVITFKEWLIAQRKEREWQSNSISTETTKTLPCTDTRVSKSKKWDSPLPRVRLVDVNSVFTSGPISIRTVS